MSPMIVDTIYNCCFIYDSIIHLLIMANIIIKTSPNPLKQFPILSRDQLALILELSVLYTSYSIAIGRLKFF